MIQLQVEIISGRRLSVVQCVVAPKKIHPTLTPTSSGWLRAGALTCRLISLVGVKWSCLRINERAFPLTSEIYTPKWTRTSGQDDLILGSGFAKGVCTPTLTRTSGRDDWRRVHGLGGLDCAMFSRKWLTHAGQYLGGGVYAMVCRCQDSKPILDVPHPTLTPTSGRDDWRRPTISSCTSILGDI